MLSRLQPQYSKLSPYVIGLTPYAIEQAPFVGSKALGWAEHGLLFVPTGCVSDGGGGGTEAAAEAGAEAGAQVGVEARARCGIHLHLGDCSDESRAPPPSTSPSSKAQSSSKPPTDADDDLLPLVLTAEEERLVRFAETHHRVLLLPRRRRGGGDGGGGGDAMEAVRGGCYDAYGALGADYALQSGEHVASLHAMVSSLNASRHSPHRASRAVEAWLSPPRPPSAAPGDAWRRAPRPAMAAEEGPGLLQRLSGALSGLGEGLLLALGPLTTQPLPRLNIDLTRISTRGISSGGDMAVQFQVAFF